MFTGLIEEVGRVVATRASDHGTKLEIAAPRTAREARTGESIAVNGCCLTLNSRRGDRLSFDLLEETIARTNLKKLRQNSRLNLERALRADGRLGGHFVQGHVDCVSAIIGLEKKGADFRLEVELPANSRIMSLRRVRSRLMESVSPLRRFFRKVSLYGSFPIPSAIRILIAQKTAISSISSSTFWQSTLRRWLRHPLLKNDGASLDQAASAHCRCDRVARRSGTSSADAQAAGFIRTALGSSCAHGRSSGTRVTEAAQAAHHHSARSARRRR